MATIEERAVQCTDKFTTVLQEEGREYIEKLCNTALRIGYSRGATEQRKIDYWKARKAFCYTICGSACPLKADDIEGGGGLVVDCDKLELFCKAMEE